MTEQGTTDEEDTRRTRPFADVLTSLNRGRTHRELSDGLQALAEAVMATHKQGTLTLTIKMSKGKASGMVEIDDLVKIKLPEGERDASLFYVDSEMNLVRDDPTQLALDLGPVRVADNPSERQAK